MPNKQKSNHTFLPILDFTSNSIYIHCARDIKTQNDYYGLDLLVNQKIPKFVPPHQIHQYWCGLNQKRKRRCNCRHQINFGASKQLVRIDCTAEHLGPIVDLVAEAQYLKKIDLALDVLDGLSPQRQIPGRKLALAMTYPTLNTAWNRNIGEKTYIQTGEKKVDTAVLEKIKELKQLVRAEAKPEEQKPIKQNTIATSNAPVFESLMTFSKETSSSCEPVDLTDKLAVEVVKPVSAKTRFSSVLARSRQKITIHGESRNPTRDDVVDIDTLKNVAHESKKTATIHFGIELLDPAPACKPIFEPVKRERKITTRTGLSPKKTR